MATTADMIKFRAEVIAANEEQLSPLRAAATTQYMDQGGSVVFLVAGSSDEAVERGVSGDIPYSPDNYVQNTCTLHAFYGPWSTTGFNMFAAQSDLQRISQRTIVAKINRNITDTIRDALSATTTTSPVATASLGWVEDQIAVLGANSVPTEEVENMYAFVSPKVMSKLRQIPEFASVDYVDVKTHAGTIKRQLRWNGINWIVSSRIIGIGTAAEQVYFFHRNGIGHAADTANMHVEAGYDGKNDMSWCNARIYHGAKLLQSSSVIKCTHDGT